MKIHEYQGKEVFRRYGVPTPRGILAVSPGEAEAAAERAKGEARAAAIKAESDAYQTFPDSARLQMVLDALPKVAQPYADALAAIDGLTVIDKGGASGVTGHVATGVQELTTLLKAQTGIDLAELVRGRGREVPAATNGTRRDGAVDAEAGQPAG